MAPQGPLPALLGSSGRIQPRAESGTTFFRARWLRGTALSPPRQRREPGSCWSFKGTCKSGVCKSLAGSADKQGRASSCGTGSARPRGDAQPPVMLSPRMMFSTKFMFSLGVMISPRVMLSPGVMLSTRVMLSLGAILDLGVMLSLGTRPQLLQSTLFGQDFQQLSEMHREGVRTPCPLCILH